MEDFILSTPFASAGIYIGVAALNLMLVQLGRRAYTERAAKLIAVESGPFITPEEEDKAAAKKLQGLTLLQAMLVFGLHLMLQEDMHSQDPGDAWASSTVLFMFGLAVIPLLTAALDNLAALWTWKYTFTHPESKIEGQVTINRWHIYKRQAHASFFSHGVLCLVLFLFTYSPILLGGAVGGFVIASSNSRKAETIVNPPPTKTQPTTPRRVTLLLIFIGLFMLFWLFWLMTQGVNASSLLALLWILASLAVARGLGAPERWGRLAATLFAAGIAAMYWIKVWLSGDIDASNSTPFWITLITLAAIHFMLRGKRMDQYFENTAKKKPAKAKK